MKEQLYASILSKQLPLIKQIFKNCGIDEFPQLSNLITTLERSTTDFPDIIINPDTFPISIPLNVQVISRLPLDIVKLSFSNNKFEPQLVFKLNINKSEMEAFNKTHQNFDTITEACKMAVREVTNNLLRKIIWEYQHDFKKIDENEIDLTNNQTIIVGNVIKFKELLANMPRVFENENYIVTQNQNTKFIVLDCSIPFDDYIILGDNIPTLNIYNLFLPKTFDVSDNICLEIYSSHEVKSKT